MNKTWLSVVIAALFEVGWVIGLKHASGWLEWGGTLVAIFCKFHTHDYGFPYASSRNSICSVCRFGNGWYCIGRYFVVWC